MNLSATMNLKTNAPHHQIKYSTTDPSPPAENELLALLLAASLPRNPAQLHGSSTASPRMVHKRSSVNR